MNAPLHILAALVLLAPALGGQEPAPPQEKKAKAPPSPSVVLELRVRGLTTVLQLDLRQTIAVRRLLEEEMALRAFTRQHLSGGGPGKSEAKARSPRKKPPKRKTPPPGAPAPEGRAPGGLPVRLSAADIGGLGGEGVHSLVQGLRVVTLDAIARELRPDQIPRLAALVGREGIRQLQRLAEQRRKVMGKAAGRGPGKRGAGGGSRAGAGIPGLGGGGRAGGRGGRGGGGKKGRGGLPF